MQFNLVICGLDSVDARRWMSATLVNLVDPEVPESLKPLIDGGTEGALVFLGPDSRYRCNLPSPAGLMLRGGIDTQASRVKPA